MLQAVAELGAVIAIAVACALLGRWIMDGIGERIYGRKR